MDDHFAFQRLVIQDIDLDDAAMSYKAGLTLEAHDSFVIVGGVHTAKRVLERIHPVPCALDTTHARANCMHDADSTSA